MCGDAAELPGVMEPGSGFSAFQPYDDPALLEDGGGKSSNEYYR